MIGWLYHGANKIVGLEDNGTWTAAAPEFGPIAQILNATENPDADYHTGDHHTPYGAAPLSRAAQRFECEARLEREPEPLPEGAIP